MTALIPKIIADFTTQLSTAISIGGTTFSLASIVDDDGNTIPNGKYCFTIDNGSSGKEYLMGDMVAGVVSNVVSITRQGTEVSGAVRAHRIGASVILTDFVVLQRVADILRGVLTLDGSSPLAYDTAPTLSNGLQVATVAYVLSVVTGGTVNFDNQVIQGVAGETLGLPKIVYLKEADARWWLSDADLTTTFQALQLGVARGSASAGATVSIQLSGIASGFSGLVAGTKYYLSNTAGGISSTPGTYSVFIGWALSTTTMLLAPESIYRPTAKEKDAMAGSQSIPSSTNKFLTQDNTTQATTDQSQATQNGTIETGEADATTKKNLIAQSFIPSKTKIRGVKLYKSANTGTFTGDVVVSLQADSAGSPSGSNLASVTILNAVYNALSTGEFEALFSSEYASLVPGSLYWIVIDPSTSDNSNHPNLGTNTAGGYASGSVKYKNTTDSWTAVSTIDLYFKTLEGKASQVAMTSSDGRISPSLVPQILATVLTSVSIVDGGSSTEQTLFSKNIPGGLLGTSNIIKGRLYFSAFAVFNSTTFFKLRLKYGSTTIATAQVDANDAGVGSSTTGLKGYADFEIVANGSASIQLGSITLALRQDGTESDNDTIVNISKAYGSGSGTGAENSANDLNLTLTGEYSDTNTANDLTMLYGYVELIRQ